MIDYKGDIIRPNTLARGPLMNINSLCVSNNTDAADVSTDCNLGNVLEAQVTCLIRVLFPNLITMSTLLAKFQQETCLPGRLSW